jgi:hypothetical protein
MKFFNPFESPMIPLPYISWDNQEDIVHDPSLWQCSGSVTSYIITLKINSDDGNNKIAIGT